MGENMDTVALIARQLPFLRRYARALTGNQIAGDTLAAATLETIIKDRNAFDRELTPRAALFGVFHQLWLSSNQPVVGDEAGTMRVAAQRHLAGLTANSREALLLNSVEGFSREEVAQIMRISPEDVEGLIKAARSEMEVSIAGRVMIIEDEAIIAMDIESLVTQCGHEVVGIARTYDEAIELGKKEEPDLILADIQLADNSSGIDAVNDLLGALGSRPVIFITAFPERLLTGERREPAFLISKPYKEEQILSAVSQAMFFASTETLEAQG